MNNIQKSLSVLTESMQVKVEINTTKTANGKDIYSLFPQLKKEFKNAKTLTGFVKKDAIDSELDKIEVQLAKFNNGRTEKFTYVAPFKAEDIKEI